MLNTLLVVALAALALWALTVPGGIITLLFVAAVLYLAYKRLSLATFTATFFVLLLAYQLLGAPAGVWKGFLWLAFTALALFNLAPLRKSLVTRPFMKIYRRMLPNMSSTERKPSKPARCGGMANSSPANRIGRSCSARKRRSSPPKSRPFLTAPAKNCAA